MTLYRLYLESGPKRKKTMVHVLELLGCVVTGPTTGEALEKTSEAIRTYLRFLQRHGEQVGDIEDVQTEIAEHITEGSWLGNGDPSLLFQPDTQPLTPEDVEIYIRHLTWSRAEIVELVSGLSEKQWQEKPEGARSIRFILEHIFGAEYSYIRPFGKLEGVKGPGVVEKMSQDELLAWMAHVRASEIAKLRSLDEQQRSEPFKIVKITRTARRTVRRMLEHEWEHLVELRERLGVSG
jgi:uncharacterized damage-inducible protein DinB/predicted RNase H-like HicB family nuclease